MTELSIQPERKEQTDKQLAALTALLDAMMRASRICDELHALQETVGDALDELAACAGVPFEDVQHEFIMGLGTPKKRKKRVTA